jgi:Uma2 family endonuclease
MASAASTAVRQNDYPTRDGRPMGETDWHCKLLMSLRQTLAAYYAADPRVYASGNLLVFYVPGDKRRHLSPDVFVVKGVPKRDRPNYLIWEEGKGPDVVIELTSASTRHEDVEEKYQLYQDRLRVPEYFLFDPLGDYLDPPLRGYRLRQGKYQPIRAVKGRLPSKVLGLHLERDGHVLRLFDPVTGQWLPTAEERATQAEERTAQAEERTAQAEEKISQVEAENERLRQELEALRRQQPRKSGR